MTKTSRYEIDMTTGAILPKLLVFALPMMLTNVLQLLFTTADSIVVGKFAGDASLAAVGATVSLISLITNLFLGLSVGANVTAARAYGSGDPDGISKTVHTTIVLAVIAGVILNIVGIFLAPWMMTFLNTPEEILPLSTLYLRIYFFCMVPMCVYNFGSGVLRAIGDSRRPLIFLIIGGIVNIGFNLFFVIVCKLGVAGVAIGTFLSQSMSAALTVRCLACEEGPMKLSLSKLHIDRAVCAQILRIGIPAGIQSTMYSIANVAIQSAINLFGDLTIAANAAAVNLEDTIYFALNAIMQAVTSFTGQNMGKRDFARIRRVLLLGIASCVAAGLFMSSLEWIFAPQILSIFTDSAEVVAIGVTRLRIVTTLYFMCGVMECFIGSMRGMGAPILPTVVTLISVCGVRLLWLAFVFPLPSFHRPEMIYILYPLTWLLASLIEGICCAIVYKKKKAAAQSAG